MMQIKKTSIDEYQILRKYTLRHSSRHEIRLHYQSNFKQKLVTEMGYFFTFAV